MKPNLRARVPLAVLFLAVVLGASLTTADGLGWSTRNGVFGHGGAHATNMTIDANRGLITVFMVQETGGFPKDGGKSQSTFQKAAMERFGSSRK